MHDQPNIKICNAKQAKLIFQYKKIKIKLYKNNAAIWYNKVSRYVCMYVYMYVCVRACARVCVCVRVRVCAGTVFGRPCVQPPARASPRWRNRSGCLASERSSLYKSQEEVCSFGSCKKSRQRNFTSPLIKYGEK
jgi:hypothetical protein